MSASNSHYIESAIAPSVSASETAPLSDRDTRKGFLSSATKAAIAASSVAVANVSHAAFDVSAAVTTLTTDGTAAITAVGGAMISLAALAAVVRWAKAAFF